MTRSGNVPGKSSGDKLKIGLTALVTLGALCCAGSVVNALFGDNGGDGNSTKYDVTSSPAPSRVKTTSAPAASALDVAYALNVLGLASDVRISDDRVDGHVPVISFHVTSCDPLAGPHDPARGGVIEQWNTSQGATARSLRIAKGATSTTEVHFHVKSTLVRLGTCGDANTRAQIAVRLSREYSMTELSFTPLATQSPTPEAEPSTPESPAEEDEQSEDVYTPPAPKNVWYKNCAAARDAGAAPVYRGEPGYGSHLDRDDDGVGCE